MVSANSRGQVDGPVGDLALACLDCLPEFVAYDGQLRHVGDDPFALRIEARDTLAGGRILHIALAVPHQATDVEFIVDDAGAAPDMTADRGVVPQLAGRS
ncbi:hypothetical protein ASC75_24920 [Aminobacter sp. DSM 101952]|nr:hypothetical protein ASC75_24920 [Aminobacter sp. DSM 101952]